MSDNRALYTEEAIIGAVKSLLAGRVNEFLNDIEFHIPPIEFGEYRGGDVVVPVISLSGCEKTEKERIIRLDVYSLTIIFTMPETEDSELFCYAYASAVCKAIELNPTLGGIADRAVVVGKKYIEPKVPNCGMDWEMVISLRITVESFNNVS